MKGYLYYSKVESLRNMAFIDDLQTHAKRIGWTLELLVDEEEPNSDVDFILFRDRNPSLSAKWEALGFRLFNSAEVNNIANDKFETFEFATFLGIPTIPTKKVRQLLDITTYPCVIKTTDGHGGNEVFLCTSKTKAREVLKQFKQDKLIAQPYIESSAQDIRVFMLGNDVLGAVKRTGNGSFKSNYTLGGSISKYELDDWQIRDAQTISSALKSDYIGIDFLLLPDGSWLLNEIEDPVGARSLYATHDFSVAESVIKYIQKNFAMATTT